MSPKAARFVAEYLIDLNGAQAAIRAGYSAKTARAIAHRLLTKADIQRAVADAKRERAQRTEITADRVLQELARIAFFDIRKLYDDCGRMKAPHELDDESAAVLAGVDVTEEFAGSGEARTQTGFTKKAKLFDKTAALTLAMRHLGMLTDKVEVTASVRGSVRYQANIPARNGK